MKQTRILFNSIHASLAFDMADIFKTLNMEIVKWNCDRSFDERPRIPGVMYEDYGDELRHKIESKTCTEKDFDGIDMVFLMNPSDFDARIPHLAGFRPTVGYLHGQWLPKQLDGLALSMNANPNLWMVVYSKIEEEQLGMRLHGSAKDRMVHIRFAKRFTHFYPWIDSETLQQAKLENPSLPDQPPERAIWIYTSCMSIHRRGDSCCWQELQKIREGFHFILSGRHTEEVDGQGLIPFEQLIRQYQTCGAYMGVPAWPAPIVLNMIEAMCSGAPVAYYNNRQGIDQEGIFNDGVGSCSDNIEGLRSFLRRCLDDKAFQQDQTRRSLERAKEFFDFRTQIKKWEQLFTKMGLR